MVRLAFMKIKNLLFIPAAIMVTLASCGGGDIDVSSPDAANFSSGQVKIDGKWEDVTLYKHEPFSGKTVEYKGQNIHETEEYVSGKKHGESCDYDYMGRLTRLVTYEKGEQTGPCEGYYEEKNELEKMSDEDLPLQYEGNFTDGERTGKWVFYKPDGEVLETVEEIESLKDEKKYKLRERIYKLEEKFSKSRKK